MRMFTVTYHQILTTEPVFTVEASCKEDAIEQVKGLHDE